MSLKPCQREIGRVFLCLHVAPQFARRYFGCATVHHFRVLALGVACLCSFGCAQNYQLIPPSSATGLACIQQCQMQETDCHQEVSAAARACQQTVKDEYSRCVMLYPNPSNYCVRRNCPISSNATCTEAYQQCYQQCGGQLRLLD